MTAFRLSVAALATTAFVVGVSCTSLRKTSIAFDLPIDEHRTMTINEDGSGVSWSEFSYNVDNLDIHLHILVHPLSTRVHDDADRKRVLKEALQEDCVTLAMLCAKPKPGTNYRHEVVVRSMTGMEVGFVAESLSRVLRVLVGEACVIVVWLDSADPGISLVDLSGRLDSMNVRES